MPVHFPGPAGIRPGQNDQLDVLLEAMTLAMTSHSRAVLGHIATGHPFCFDDWEAQRDIRPQADIPAPKGPGTGARARSEMPALVRPMAAWPESLKTAQCRVKYGLR